jgi:3-oxoacid CoA-transferase subunit B
MKERLDEMTIALRAAREFSDGAVVNLGYGMPGLCADFIPGGRTVYFQSENGVLGYGRLASDAEKDYELINASDQPVTRASGMCFFDSALAFDMIRGGHIDIVVLGAYQVSEKGDLANWGRPGRPATGMGGAMDLAVGAGRVIVTMLHTTREGEPRIVKECTFPLTASRCIDLIITDLAVIEVTQPGLVLRETAPGWTFDEIQTLTGARLEPAPDLKEIEL